ncbi:hypothetical protein DSO57_1003879 [Entomophthora muscae]|uniref:Uncharacterized protein n=1 Tax=Entomophthora muscae TaxID=34485 RepID=A0ACC2RNA2_9FUNG|nr:hypothetical protein DSO57_1003879 [Entomophthora muscae]
MSQKLAEAALSAMARMYNGRLLCSCDANCFTFEAAAIAWRIPECVLELLAEDEVKCSIKDMTDR